jgi:hypothetical protein
MVIFHDEYNYKMFYSVTHLVGLLYINQLTENTFQLATTSKPLTTVYKTHRQYYTRYGAYHHGANTTQRER